MVAEFREVLRSHPVVNLPADASARSLIDAALLIASASVGRGTQGRDLPRIGPLPRVYSAEEPADTMEHVPEKLIYVAGAGLMVLGDVVRAD